MTLITLGMLILGLVMLVAGGEILVRGASALAAIAGITPLVIGLTVVAFGTSAPELAVSVQAGLEGKPDIAVSNIVGSNIFNILFILGICALVAPLTVSIQLVRREVPVMIGVSLVFLLMAGDGRIGLTDGAILTLGIIGYTAWLLISSRRETAAARAEYAREYSEEQFELPRGFSNLLLNLGLLIAGLVILVIGARLLVDGASTLARFLGVSDVIIGLTIVSIGTSLPEVATSLIASLKGERDIATGNVIGSNIFNMLSILGISALVTPGGLQIANSIQEFDLPVMVAVALVCLPVFCTGMCIDRWKGGLFLSYYLAYTTYLILHATEHESRHGFTWAMSYVVLPVTVLTLAIFSARDLMKNRRRPALKTPNP